MLASAPFASEVRVRGCRNVSRTSEAGHQLEHTLRGDEHEGPVVPPDHDRPALVDPARGHGTDGAAGADGAASPAGDRAGATVAQGGRARAAGCADRAVSGPVAVAGLIASTYPLEVVQAERWVSANKNLKDDQLKTPMDKQTWDESVK